MSESGRRFCENCGARISQTANFCSNCGTAWNPTLEEPIGPLAEEPTGPLAPTPVQEPAIRVPTPVQAPTIRVNTSGMGKAGATVFALLASVLITLGLEPGTAMLVAVVLLTVFVASWLLKNWGNIEFVTTPERRGRPPIPAAVRRRVPVAVLHNEALPLYAEKGLRLENVLTDNGREFCGSEGHPYRIYLELNEIKHRTTKVRGPQTNGFVERFNRTVLDEFFRVAFREKLYESVEALQNDLDKSFRQ